MTRFGFLCLAMFLPTAAAAQTLSLQDAAGLTEAPTSGAVIYTAREFRTMDPARPTAEAVAVRDGRFLAVGSLAEVQRAAPDARLDRTFDGKTVTAGFVEQHVHPVLAALTMNTHVLSIEDWDAIDGFSPAIRDADDYRAKLAAALKAHPDKTKPFVTWGYHHYFHGKLDRATLDKLAPDFPVIVWHRSAHEFYFNSAGLKAAGIDAAFIKSIPATAQEQSSLERGHFYEQGMFAVLPKAMPLLGTPEKFRRGLEFSVRYYHQNGITLACEPGGLLSRPLQDAVNDVLSKDETPFNHCFIADGKSLLAANPEDPVAMLKATRALDGWGKGRTFYLPGRVKLFADGAIYSQLMQMKDGYTDGHHGEWIMPPSDLAKAFNIYWDAGLQIHIHTNGDAGGAEIVKLLEAAQARKPRTDHRTAWVHFGFAAPQEVKRWAELGGIVSSNPYYVTALAGRYAKLGIGPERAANIAPHGDVMANGGMMLSFHSDMPMAPAKPLQLVWAGVNRFTAEGPVSGPRHRVDIDTAMKAITINPAASIGLEDRVGSITVGKDANLTVLETSPWETAPEKLKDIKVWGTMLEGRVQPVGTDKTAALANPAATFCLDGGGRYEIIATANGGKDGICVLNDGRKVNAWEHLRSAKGGAGTVPEASKMAMSTPTAQALMDDAAAQLTKILSAHSD
jgi:predicted amidohydrolase YtcJ